MSNSSNSKPEKDALLPEYRLDYSRSRPNRFASKRGVKKSIVVMLDPDVSTVFKDANSVNTALRALLSAMPVTRPARKRN